jgi:anti-sigma B factor antagonist
MNPFNVAVNRGPNETCIIELEGYLDAHTATALETAIEAAIDGGCTRLIVNFAALDYISSAGLGVFMVFIERVRSSGGDIKMAAMQPKVFTVFDLLGFPVLFNIHATVDEAIGAFTAA